MRCNGFIEISNALPLKNKSVAALSKRYICGCSSSELPIIRIVSHFLCTYWLMSYHGWRMVNVQPLNLFLLLHYLIPDFYCI